MTDYFAPGVVILAMVVAMPVKFGGEDGLFAANTAVAAGRAGDNSGGGNSGNSGADNGDDGGGAGGGPGNSGANNGGRPGDDGDSVDGGPVEGDIRADGVDPGAGVPDTVDDGTGAPEPSFGEMTDDELEAYVRTGAIEDGVAIALTTVPGFSGVTVLDPHEEARMIARGWTISH